VTVPLSTIEDNGRRIEIARSISCHPIVASVDLMDLVLLLCKIETKVGDFFFIARGGTGHSSSTTKGGNSSILGYVMICTSSLDV
jgi:hypothetical protein